MLPPRPHRLGGSPTQMPCGFLLSSKVSTAAAYCGMAPTKPADLYCWVVPVLPSIGRVQWALAPAACAVPDGTSLLRPTTSVLASVSGTACSHGCSGTSTLRALRSSTSRIGLGGHHTPPLISVAATFASSRVLTGAGLSLNEALPGLFGLLLKCCAWDSADSPLAFGSGGRPEVLLARLSRRPSRIAMSTIGSMPTCSSRITKPVFGDWASASCSVIWDG